MGSEYHVMYLDCDGLAILQKCVLDIISVESFPINHGSLEYHYHIASV